MTFKDLPERERLKYLLCPEDYLARCSEVLPEPIFRYLMGGSRQGHTAQGNVQAFEALGLVSTVWTIQAHSMSPSSLPWQHPIALAPVAHQALYHPEAEKATAQGAAATHTPLVLSAGSDIALHQVNAVLQQSGANRSLLIPQLYLTQEEAHTMSLIEQAEALNAEALVLTLDAGIQLPSLDALRAGFVPPAHWATQHPLCTRVSPAQVARVVGSTRLPVWVKGVLNPEDAKIARDVGVQGLVVSNHGGRTVDGVSSSLAVLPALREAWGRQYPLLLDSGVRSGFDVFKALALGADAVLIGRLQACALAVAGALGVAHLIKMMLQELEVAMALCGCSTLSDIHPGCILQPD